MSEDVSKEVVDYFMRTLNKKLFKVHKVADDETVLLWIDDDDERVISWTNWNFNGVIDDE